MLPPDLYYEIYRRLGINDSISFYGLSKAIYNAVDLYVNLRAKKGNISLKSEQLTLLEELDSEPSKQIKILQVPPSTGKTFISLVWDVQNRKRIANYGITAIRVPTVLVENWVNELIRIYPAKYNKDPEKSAFIVVHTSNKPHLNYIKNVIATNSALSANVEMLLFAASTFSDSIAYIKNKVSTIKNIIIDEAHRSIEIIKTISLILFNTAVTNIGGYLLLLTASDIKLPRYRKDSVQKIQRNQELVEKAVPKIKNIFYDINKTDQLLEDLFKLKDKVVIFVGTIELMKTVKPINGVKLIKHKKDEDITKFSQFKGKALFIVSFNKANYGININSDLVVMRDISVVGGTMFHQAQHRFIRITNNYEEVTFFNAISDYAIDMYNVAVAYIIREYGNIYVNLNPLGAKHPGLLKAFLDTKNIDIDSLNYEEMFIYIDPPKGTSLGKKDKLLKTTDEKVRTILHKVRDTSFLNELIQYYKDKNSYYDVYKDVLIQQNDPSYNGLNQKIVDQIKRFKEIIS